MAGILSAILRALTRYSANDLQFPVNDRSPFTGKSHAIGGADNIPAFNSRRDCMVKERRPIVERSKKHGKRGGRDC